MKLDNHVELFEKLYPFQQDAIALIDKYLRSKTKKHALIKMPTGTGKTLLIAYVSNYYKKFKNILLVTPSKGVTEQLRKELQEGLVKKFGLNKPLKDIEKLYPRNIEDLLKTRGSTIFVCTTKSLNDIKEKDPLNFKKLKEKINLIIFDEGHREPAEKWKHTIRDFNKKVILFTATPLRNDNSNFYLDNKFIYNYSFHRAVAENKIREPRFIKYQGVDKLEDFIDYIVRLTKQLEEKYNTSIKTILRFNNADDMLKAKQLLNKKGEEVVAIHETFKTDTDNGLFKDVPNPKELSTTYWVHQNKLIEGIDDNNFSILAIYQPFNDVRSLIQQVGRVIRKNDTVPESLVIYRDGTIDQEKLYKEYLNYESKLDEDINLINFNYDDYFNKLISYLPSFMHINNRFLRKINYLKSELDGELLENFRLPLKTNIFYSEEGLKKFDDYCVCMINNLLIGHNAKIVYELKNSSLFTFVVVYSIYRSSPYLVNNYFIEPKLGISVLKINDKLLFYYDSSDIIPHEIVEDNKRVSADNLQRLFDNNSTFKQLTVNNGFIANSIRREIIFSENIELVSPTITDKYKFCTTIYGVSSGHDNRARTRYIGFSNSRVSDSSNLFSLQEYISWIDYLSNKLNSKTSKPAIFDRYAPKTKTPANIEPINILIDIDEPLRGAIFDGSNNRVFFEKLSFDIENWKFSIEADGKRYELGIEFDNSKYQYRLKRIGNWRLYIYIDFQKVDLISYINKLQSFQILTKDCKTVYCKGDFYEIGISNDDNRLQDILVEYEKKESLVQKSIVLNEKGKNYKGGNKLKVIKPKWDYNSLFYLVSNYARNLNLSNKGSKEIANVLKNLDYLICTDLGTEIADFIGLNERDKAVYFIHCKAHSARLSATAFQDICGQIIKNLEYVNPLSQRKPKDIDRWDKDWYSDSYCVRKNRMIINPKRTPAEKIWDKIKKISLQQDSNIYVWALLGNMFSMEDYLKEKQKGGTPKPEIIQIEYLLMSTWTAVQNSNAKFKIYFDKK
ncbi:DEAD/DEAH box helicase [Anoxybacillus sp. PDR2]|uniref:DEAD/DEAH box helicase n=1 Tax=Anoxybacillaceae TaxID=3120669 RepID=UPI00131813B2|nr:DEAD/DEAH box helicase family protein [Anoxybacillus sp. PDR2]QHC04706.1 DEAD/DEAH box helicase family protein [Anoxybacillus sp. PDR2]